MPKFSLLLSFCALVLTTPVLANFTQADSEKARAYCRGEFREATVFVENQSQASSMAKAEIVNNLVSDVKTLISRSLKKP